MSLQPDSPTQAPDGWRADRLQRTYWSGEGHPKAPLLDASSLVRLHANLPPRIDDGALGCLRRGQDLGAPPPLGQFESDVGERAADIDTQSSALHHRDPLARPITRRECLARRAAVSIRPPSLMVSPSNSGAAVRAVMRPDQRIGGLLLLRRQAGVEWL